MQPSSSHVLSTDAKCAGSNQTRQTKRPYFKLKSQWALWEADRIAKQIAELRAERIPSADWRRVSRKTEAISRLEESRYNWERRAQSYRRQEAG